MQNETVIGRATRRRNALLALLHKGPQRYEDIIAALSRDRLFFCDDADDPAKIARKKAYQFRRDLSVLRRLDYQIDFDQQSKCYALLETPFGLALNKKQLTAFALVLATFHKKTIPYASDIDDLLSFLMSRLPQEQQQAVVDQHLALNIELPERTDYSKIDPVMLREIERAILRRQQLEFTYRSRAGKELRHVIEPQPLDHKDGHVYLRGWCVDCQKELIFRLDFIVSDTAKMLRKKVERSRPRPPAYQLRYHLTPRLAHHSVSEHFPGQHVVYHPDGSATVTVTIADLFEARQILLRYGENCTVESPPELLRLLQPVAVHFQRYLTPEG